MDLVPREDHGEITYTAEYHPLVRVDGRLTSSVAGIDSVANSILLNPHESADHDPILQFLDESVARDGGASLTLDDMRQIANVLEERTARRFATKVGGVRQVAILSNGAISEFDVPSVDQPEKAGPMFDWLIDAHIRNSQGLPGVVGVIASPTKAVFVSRSEFSGVRQQLDNVLFTGTTFTNCVLTYGGSPMALFDKTNVIKNSVLVVDAQVGEDNPFIVQLKSDHPELFKTPLHTLEK